MKFKEFLDENIDDKLAKQFQIDKLKIDVKHYKEFEKIKNAIPILNKVKASLYTVKGNKFIKKLIQDTFVNLNNITYLLDKIKLDKSKEK